ncbi:hypothetical protein SAMN04515654_11515 [Halanaerobium congolense]|jgi:vacuolar-type H+-ATPase subunit I/STV1|uniref:Uncharacterized protein n=1 Tax=Halanaerobium congolense TaxID=54121 RepID=A0A1G8NH22_9FIRM|nr:hypothetical protein [Halanaerobium congolense]OEG62167.1 MAG: hypothetical protein BHK79_07230 [Halanaerobium sp. MDAL1]SDI79387.1 hypothetical protein SAMN04515654_11515 [Halanaerobium congolense]SET48827.1 hypothetical protein SAMN04515653_11615 [Halanaerobium congolense]
MNIWDFLGVVSKADYNELESKIIKTQAKIEDLEEVILEKNLILMELIEDKIDESKNFERELIKNHLESFEKKEETKFNDINQKIENLNNKTYSEINKLRNNHSKSLNKISKKIDNINDLMKVIMTNDLLDDMEKIIIESKVKKLLLADLKKIIRKKFIDYENN